MRTSTSAFVSMLLFAASGFALASGCSDEETDKPGTTTIPTTTTTTTTTSDGGSGATGGGTVGGGGGAVGGSGGEAQGGSGGEAQGGSGGSGQGGSGGSGQGGSGGGAQDFCPTTPTISEYLPNPVGGDAPNEFIEIAVDNGAALDNVALVVLEAEGTGMGNIDLVIDLDGVTSGANCLILVTKGNDPYGTGDFTEVSVAGNGDMVENGSQSLLLVDYGTTLPTANTDLDTDNDGVLDSTPFTILDAITFRGTTTTDAMYLTTFHRYDQQTIGFTLQGFSLAGGTTPIAGDIDGAVPSWTYNPDPDMVDPDSAGGYALTPGAPNPAL